VLFYLQREGAKSLTLSSLPFFQACWLPFCRISVLAHEFLLVIIFAEISFSGFHLSVYLSIYLVLLENFARAPESERACLAGFSH
jgi:hypothetical protein